MNEFKKIKTKVTSAALTALLSAQAWADNTLQLNNISGSTGAGSNDVTALMTKGQNVAQKTVDFALIAAACVGVLLVIGSLWGIYKAQKDQRESPKTAIAGLVVGACLTAVALLVGLLRNTINVG